MGMKMGAVGGVGVLNGGNGGLRDEPETGMVPRPESCCRLDSVVGDDSGGRDGTSESKR